MPIEIKGDISGSLVELLYLPAQTGEGNIKLWSSRTDKRATYTYPDIRDASFRLAARLAQQDVQPHDRVVLWAPNSPWWVIAYFATLRVGGVVVPFDTNADTDFLKKVIEATEPRLIIAGTEQIEKMPSSNAVPALNINQIAKMSSRDDYQTGASLSSADLAEIVFTSGTTGHPKGVVLTHGNIRFNVESIRRVVQLKPGHSLLSILPLSHMFEATVGMLTPVKARASIIYADTLRPENLLRAIREEHITCMAVVPQVLQLFKNGIEQQVSRAGKTREWYALGRISSFLPAVMRRILFSRLHERLGGQFDFFVCGGAPLDPKLAAAWENFGIKVVQGYGMTEASPVVSCDSLSDRNHAYVGRPLPRVNVRIAPDGEILVKGPNVMLGYWKNERATDEVLKDGWYYSGDLGSLEGGRLKILGRKKNMIVLPDGSNVYPEDLEQILAREGGLSLRDSIVFYRETIGRGELHAVLLLTDPLLDPKVLIRSANQHLTSNHRIQGYTIWPDEDFPRTHTRKPKRDEIIGKI